MSNDVTSESARDSSSHPPGILAARAQIEAARLRQKGLIATGRLSRPSLDESLPKKSLPGYTLLRELHRGGQGVVYVATQSSTGRQVAIKLLRCWPNSDRAGPGLARFEREVDILSRLKHPNVVTIHDCGRDHEDVFLVMDYVAGRPLDVHVSRDRPPLRELLDLFARVCDGVNAAHLRGVIHRDLKPGNILVDERGEPRVLDFGLAKIADDSADAAAVTTMTMTGQFVGSLPWASPEQAEGRGDQLDVRTDVYSLGVVLYQLLTGSFPYPVSGRRDDVVNHIGQTPPTRPSTIAATVNRELETILLKCLAKEPERRYQSAGELARDLRRYLKGEAIEARRDSIAYVVRKLVGRHRVAFAAATTMLVAVVCALIVSLAFWQQAAQQRTLAEQAAVRADDEAEQARAVTAFMRDVLTSVDPENQGADVRLTQVLANASHTASERFAAHPQQEAQVRELLGKVYLNLSLWPDAEAELVAALALWRQHAGADDPRTLRAESDCAGIALNLSKYREVEAALTALLPRMTQILGPDNRETLAARRSLAIAVLFQGRIDEAEPVLLELRAHPALANDDAMQMRIAQTLIDVNQWRRAYLPDCPERDAALAREEALAHEWIDRSTRLHGPVAGGTLQARVILAEIMCDQSRYVDAVEQCRALLASSDGRLPECHDVSAWAMGVLAVSLGHLGEIDEPAELYLRRIACLREFGPTSRVAQIGAISDGLPYLERAGRAVEAEPLARELSEAMVKFGGVLSFSADLYIARFVSMQGRFDEAEPLFQALFAREAELAEANIRARLHMFYGKHLALRGRFEDAEAELQTATACIDDLRQGTSPTHPDDLIRAFIELFEATGDADGAAEYRQLQDEAIDRSASPATR